MGRTHREYLRESAEGIFAGEEGANLGREPNPPPRTGSRAPATPRSGAVQRALLSPFRLGARHGVVVVDRCVDGSGGTAALWGIFFAKNGSKSTALDGALYVASEDCLAKFVLDILPKMNGEVVIDFVFNFFELFALDILPNSLILSSGPISKIEMKHIN